jgi:hypothetical protein
VPESGSSAQPHRRIPRHRRLPSAPSFPAEFRITAEPDEGSVRRRGCPPAPRARPRPTSGSAPGAGLASLRRVPSPPAPGPGRPPARGRARRCDQAVESGPDIRQFAAGQRAHQ